MCYIFNRKFITCYVLRFLGSEDATGLASDEDEAGDDEDRDYKRESYNPGSNPIICWFASLCTLIGGVLVALRVLVTLSRQRNCGHHAIVCENEFRLISHHSCNYFMTFLRPGRSQYGRGIFGQFKCLCNIQFYTLIFCSR